MSYGEMLKSLPCFNLIKLIRHLTGLSQVPMQGFSTTKAENRLNFEL